MHCFAEPGITCYRPKTQISECDPEVEVIHCVALLSCALSHINMSSPIVSCLKVCCEVDYHAHLLMQHEQPFHYVQNEMSH